MQAFRGSGAVAQPYYGTVLTVLGSQLRVRVGPSTFTCNVAAPLSLCDIRAGDVVLLTYVQDRPYATAIARPESSTADRNATNVAGNVGNEELIVPVAPSAPITYLAGAGLTKTTVGLNTQRFDVGEGPGIDVTADAVGLGGDTILLFSATGAPVAEFAPDAAGLDMALAAAAVGDNVELPICTIAGDHEIPAGVILAGLGRASALTGQLTLNSGSALRDLYVNRSANTSGNLYGVVGPTGGNEIVAARISRCVIQCTQAGSGGEAYALCLRAYGIVDIEYSYLGISAVQLPYDVIGPYPYPTQAYPRRYWTHSGDVTVGAGLACDVVWSKNSVLVGGSGNTISGLIAIGDDTMEEWSDGSVLVGGMANTIEAGSTSFLGGGSVNRIIGASQKPADGSVLVGGQYNSIERSRDALIGGGDTNTVTDSDYAVLDGGSHNQIAEGPESVIGGGSANVITHGAESVIGGGAGNSIAYDDDSVIGGGSENLIDTTLVEFERAACGGDGNCPRTHNVIGGGHNNTIKDGSGGSVIGGGVGNEIQNAETSAIAGGIYNAITGSPLEDVGEGYERTTVYSGVIGGGESNVITDVSYATIGGGYGNLVTADQATIPGGLSARADKFNQMAHGGGYSGGQRSDYLLGLYTYQNQTGPYYLTLNGSDDYVAGYKLQIADNVTWAFTVVVVARQEYPAEVGGRAVWKFEGCLDRTAHTVALVGSVHKTVLAQDATAAAWTVEVTADDTYKALLITVNAPGGRNIAWRAHVQTLETDNPVFTIPEV